MEILETNVLTYFIFFIFSILTTTAYCYIAFISQIHEAVKSIRFNVKFVYTVEWSMAKPSVPASGKTAIKGWIISICAINVCVFDSLREHIHRAECTIVHA